MIVIFDEFCKMKHADLTGAILVEAGSFGEVCGGPL